MIRFLKTRIHGYIDYLAALLLIFTPWIFGFRLGAIESWVPMAFGIAAIVYSLITDYELGAFPLISVRTHLLLDFSAGLLLAFSPWIFGFAGETWVPHFAFGLFSVIVSLITEKEPQAERRSHSDRPAAVN